MSYKIDLGESISLSQESGTVKEVLQNIRLILSTPKGTVPLYREFGLSQDFLDKPLPVAQSLLAVAVHDAVETFEPRAQILNVSARADPANPGRLLPVVEVEISGVE